MILPPSPRHTRCSLPLSLFFSFLLLSSFTPPPWRFAASAQEFPPSNAAAAAVSAGHDAALPVPVEKSSRSVSLQVLWDGTVVAQDVDTGEIRWSFSSGPPLSSSQGLLPPNDEDINVTVGITGNSVISDDKYVFCGTDWKLYQYDKRHGIEVLPVSPDELVRSTPALLDGAVVLGSVSTTAFLIDANSGDLVRRFDSGNSPPAAEDSKSGEEEGYISRYSEPSIRDVNDTDHLFIFRTDYSLRSLAVGTGEILWNVSIGELELRSPEIAELLGLPSAKTKFNVESATEDSLNGRVPAGAISPSKINRLPAPWKIPISPQECPPPCGRLPLPPRKGTNIAALPLEGPPPSGMLFFPPMQGRDGKNYRGRALDSLALPYDEKRLDLQVPALPQGDQEVGSSSFWGMAASGIFWKELALGALIVLVFGVVKFAFPGSIRLFNRERFKQKQPLNGKKRKKGTGRSAKGNDVRVEQMPSENPLPEEVRHTDEGEHLQASMPHTDVVEFRASGGNESPGSENRGRENIYNVEGRWVGRIFVTNLVIGFGSHGTMVLAGYLEKRNVAIKRLLAQFYEKAQKEISNLIASDEHPNVVRCYAMEADSDFVYVALERCGFSLSELVYVHSIQASGSVRDSKIPCAHPTGADLEKLMSKVGESKDIKLWDDKGRPSPKLLQFMRDIVAGLAHLHDLGFVHRDLKPQNVLISSGRISCAKLSDMGISKRLTDGASSLDTHTTGSGSSGWQAPEQLLHQRQTRAVDLFSLGCVLFFCISGGNHPFGENFERDRNILNGQPDLFPVEHVPEATHLLSRLLNTDPSRRPTVKEVLLHPLFWASEKRLSFLRDASDRVELEDRHNQSPLLEALEEKAPTALGGAWDEKLDAAFLQNLGRYRRYNYGSVRDLLRVIRNKLNHYRELSQDVQQLLGHIPEGYETYFRNKFPQLLLEVYKVFYEHCKDEDLFQTYFFVKNDRDLGI